MKFHIETLKARVGGADYFVRITIYPPRVPHVSYDSPAAFAYTPRRIVVGRIFDSDHIDVTDTIMPWTRREIEDVVLGGPRGSRGVRNQTKEVTA